MDIFLSQLLGVYFIIVGVVVLMRRKSLLSTVGGLGKDRSLMMIIGAIELIGGIALVLAYPVVSFSPVGVLSLLGYVLAIEGVLYLGGQTLMQKVVRSFNTQRWYVIGGIVAIALGAYLVNHGFSLGYF